MLQTIKYVQKRWHIHNCPHQISAALTHTRSKDYMHNHDWGSCSICGFFSQLLYSLCSLQKQADELNNSITEGSFQKTTVFVLLTWMCLYLVPMQRVQHFPLSEVQDLHCRVTGCSDKEITSWVESQAVHHTTVDWKTRTHTHTHDMRGMDIFSLKCIPKLKNTLSACN